MCFKYLNNWEYFSQIIEKKNYIICYKLVKKNNMEVSDSKLCLVSSWSGNFLIFIDISSWLINQKTSEKRIFLK